MKIAKPFAHPLDAVRQGYIKHCFLCFKSPVESVGVFVPQDEEMQRAVEMKRGFPAAAGNVPFMYYGLCADHAAKVRSGEVGSGEIAEMVEHRILDLARLKEFTTSR
jgi:hypothetical protein